MEEMLPIALSIAGSDPSGGAGIQADLKTFHRFHVYGTAAITLLTVQNTRRVSRVEILPPDLILQQIEAVLEDLPPNVVKTGALGNAATIEAIASLTFLCPLVVDPVMISKHGASLMDPAAREILTKLLLPKAALVTPNLHEAAALTGLPVATPTEMREAARRIADFGPPAVLIKGGHLQNTALDILYSAGQFHEFPGVRHNTPHTHGTGCTYSAAIAALLALGQPLPNAVAAAKAFIAEAIRTNPGLGAGNGPVNHWA